MARHFFVSDVLVRPAASTVQLADGDQISPLQLAAGQPFTLWTDRASGDKVTDCTAPDGLTPLPLTDGFFAADGTGQPPPLYGPNSDDIVVLWIDAGAGTRYPMFAIDLLARLLLVGPIDYTSAAFKDAVRGIAGSGATPGSGTDLSQLQAAINNKADRVDGKVPNSQLPTAFIKRTADQGPPTEADCVALQYPDDSYILQD